jgi:hypothetical protein
VEWSRVQWSGVNPTCACDFMLNLRGGCAEKLRLLHTQEGAANLGDATGHLVPPSHMSKATAMLQTGTEQHYEKILSDVFSTEVHKFGHVARVCERRGAYRVLVGEPRGKRPLG